MTKPAPGLRIGKTVEGDPYLLPLEALTQTFGILAKRGSGKTYTGSVMFEEFVRHDLPAVWVDPIGVAWGFRSSADGLAPALPVVVLGGDHGDLPLFPEAGEAVADLIIDDPRPMVIDLSRMRKGEMRRFMTPFLERLYHSNRAPLHVFLDEADEWAPQKPLKGSERLLGACEDLVRRGRARGLGVTMITQRPAVIHKDVLTQIEVLVLLKITGPQDIEAAREWIKRNSSRDEQTEVLGSLSSLPIGTSWWWAPGWLGELAKVNVRTRTTYDSSATPKHGEIRPDVVMADIGDTAGLQATLDAIAEKHADEDPRMLKARVDMLSTQLDLAETRLGDAREIQHRAEEEIVRLRTDLRVERDKPAQTTTIEVPVDREVIVEVPVVPDDLVTLIEQAVPTIEGYLRDMSKLVREAKGEHEAIAVRNDATHRANERRRAHLVELQERQKREADAVERDHAVPVAPAPRPTLPPREKRAGGATLKEGAKRILVTLTRHHPMRVTMAQLGTLTGYATGGGAFQENWRALRALGLVDNDGGTWGVTDEGRHLSGIDQPDPITSAEVIDRWRKVLPAGAAKILDLLLEHPDGYDKEEIAALVSMSAAGGAFQGYLQALRRNDLIEGSRPITVNRTILGLP